MKKSLFLLVSISVVSFNSIVYAWGPVYTHEALTANIFSDPDISNFLTEFGIDRNAVINGSGDLDNDKSDSQWAPFHTGQWTTFVNREYVYYVNSPSKWYITSGMDETRRLKYLMHDVMDVGVPLGHSPANEVFVNSTIEGLLEAQAESWSSYPGPPSTTYAGTMSQVIPQFYNDCIANANWLKSKVNWLGLTSISDNRTAAWQGMTIAQKLAKAFLTDYFLAKRDTVAAISGTYGVNPGGSITLSSAGSYDPDSITWNTNATYYNNGGGLASFFWDVGNDGTWDASGSMATLNYEQLYSILGPTEGRSVRLQVVDDEGRAGYATSTIAVYTPPTAVANGGYGVNPGGAVAFSSAGSYDPDGGSLTSYLWDMNNDGTFETSGASPYLNYSQLYSMVGPTEGRTIQLRVTDNEGVTSTTTSTVAVYTPPIAAGRAQYGWLGDPNAVPSQWDWDNLIDNGSQDPDHTENPAAGIVTYEWDLNNDGYYEKSGASNIRIYYSDFTALGITANENQTVTLRVTDNEGVTTIQSGIAMPVLVNPVAGMGGDSGARRGGSATLIGSGSDPDGGAITAWNWDLDGDGLYDDAYGQGLNFSYDQLVALGLTPGIRNPISLKILDDDNKITGWWQGTGYATAYLAMYPSVDGDVNVDGLVNFSDYLDFAMNFGQTQPNWYQGDCNIDGQVDISDYLLLSSNFGYTGGQTIPEPGTLGLAILGSLVLGVSRRRRGSYDRKN